MSFIKIKKRIIIINKFLLTINTILSVKSSKKEIIIIRRLDSLYGKYFSNNKPNILDPSNGISGKRLNNNKV